MASNYTSNYNLCQWQPDDKVLRTEFNADNVKIDAALGSLASSVSGKASTSALDSLKTTVDGLSSSKADASTVSALQTTVNSLKTSKADKSALDSLKTTVGQHTDALAKKGNCQFCVTNYVGSGLYGSDNSNQLTFEKKPMVVFVTFGDDTLILLQGVGGSFVRTMGGNGSYVSVHWSENSVSWSSGDVNSQMSFKNRTYQVLALLQAD